MTDFLADSPLFGITISLLFYLIGKKLHQRYPIPLFNPLLFAVASVILCLLLLNIPYEQYMKGGQYINVFILPATIALGTKLKTNFHYFKRHYKAILISIILGVVLHSVLIVLFCRLFDFDVALVATLLPKPVTTPIAIDVASSLNGIVSLTVATVVFTGIFGALIGPSLFKLTGIYHPVAQGVAMGASSHAMGTSKAIEMGEVQGAMSSVALIITGIVIVILSPIAAQFILPLFN